MPTDEQSALTLQPENPPAVPIAGAKPKSAMIEFAERGITLRSMEDAFIFAKAVIDSKMAPRGIDTPQAVLVIIQFGAEVGLPPMSALQNIALINGRPTIYGDAVPGICNASGNVEIYKDEPVGEGDTYGYRVTVKRRDRSDPVVRVFNRADAKKAGLLGKSGPWTQYESRMLLMRARTFALRDAFPELLRGLKTVEEMRDHAEAAPSRSLDELETVKAVAT